MGGGQNAQRTTMYAPRDISSLCHILLTWTLWEAGMVDLLVLAGDITRPKRAQRPMDGRRPRRQNVGTSFRPRYVPR